MRGTMKKNQLPKAGRNVSEPRKTPDREPNYSAGDDDFDVPEPEEVGAAGAEGSAPLISFTAPENTSGTRIDLFLARLVPQFSRARLQGWLDQDRIWVDGAPAGPRTRVLGGEAVQVFTAPTLEQTAFEPEAMPLTILFEDAHVLVINKPAGLVVHPAAGNWSGTLLNGLLHHVPKLAKVPRAGIVHRLDKETTGLMVVARTLEAQTALVRQLQARSVRREYLAIVAGAVAVAGKVDAPIGRHPTQRKQMAVLAADATGAKPAITHYAPVANYARGASLVECRLETGRTHQIRVHMRHVGHPLVGDQTYGTVPSRAWFGRQALHARKLAFAHPATGRTVAYEVPVPPDMAALMTQLANE